MAQSLVKLTLESNQYERNLRNAQKQLNDFTRSIGINMKSLSGMALAAGAVTGALKVAKDAFFNNEQQLDEWGRTVKASQSLYNGFLNALNNGDISGYLSNINNITEAARAAYDALDELSTFNAFSQVNVEKTRTGMTEAIAGYRMGESSKESVKAAAESYKKELQQRQKLEKEAYSQAIRDIAAQRGVAWGSLEQALSGSYGSYKELKEVMPTGKRTVYQATGQFGATMSYEVPMAVTAEEKMGEALRALNDTELQNLQALGAQAERTGNEIANIDKQVARILNGKGGAGGAATKGGGGGGGGRGVDINALVAGQWDKAMLRSANAGVRADDMSGPSDAFKAYAAAIKQESAKAEDSINRLTKAFESLNEAQGVTATGEVTKNVNATAIAAKTAASAISSIGQAFSSIEDPAARVAGLVAQAIATVAVAYAQALETDWTSKTSIYSFIAAAAAATASMITTIASIHSATGYAQGGEVQGNSYSGDNIPIMANAGEVVLTKAMTRTLAANLQGNGIGNMNLRTKVKGTELLVWLDNSLAQSGRGELVTWGQ